MKKEWKVRSVILLTQASMGIGWIIIGVSNLFMGNRLADGLSAIALLALLACTFLPYYGRREEPDEMAREHLEKAQAMGYTVLGSCLMAAYFVGRIWKAFPIPFQALAPILFGVGCLAVGLYFSRLETRGEPWQDW